MRNITYFKADAAEIQQSERELCLKATKTLQEYCKELQSLSPRHEYTMQVSRFILMNKTHISRAACLLLYRDGPIKEPYLFTVKGCREGCCFGIHIMLGELLLGLPNPELLMLFVLLGIPMPWPTWEWFIIFLGFIGNIPLKEKNHPQEMNLYNSIWLLI